MALRTGREEIIGRAVDVESILEGMVFVEIGSDDGLDSPVLGDGFYVLKTEVKRFVAGAAVVVKGALVGGAVGVAGAVGFKLRSLVGVDPVVSHKRQAAHVFSEVAHTEREFAIGRKRPFGRSLISG